MTADTADTSGALAAAPPPSHRAPAVPVSAARKWGTLAICAAAALLLGIDNTVLNLAVPRLVAAMHPSSSQILWIADAYSFALGGLLVVMGSLGDRIGRKRLLLVGATGFGLASLLTAYSGSPELLIAARALLGVAGATIMPSTASLIRSTFTDPKERTLAMGISGGGGAAGFALGPVVGGLLLNHFWWGSVFLVNVPVMLLIVGCGSVLLVESRHPAPGRLDWPGLLLSVVGLVAVIYAVQTGAQSGPARPQVLGAAVVGVAALLLFGLRQARIAHPLIDLPLLRSRAFAGSLGANVVAILSVSALSLAFSQYFQDVRGWSPLQTGLALLAGPAGAMIGGPCCALVIGRIGRARTVALGLGLMAAGMVCFSLIGPHTGYAVLAPAVVVNGIGMGLVFGTTNDTMMASAPKERAGGAAAIGETAMEIGGGLGIAVLGSVLTACYRSGLHLPAGVGPAAASAARQTVGGATAAGAAVPAPQGAELIAAARHAFVHAMNLTTLIGAVLLALGAAATLFALRGVPAVIADPAPADADPTEAATSR
ncbi:MFS transporter [Streptacidiphilus sp. PB12-B1b]|uniref:MFS transporter n=1 Tax=Streptacidiphilus sp. PB12-B1b TaxID=2705012 RepID=UPI0015FE6F3A|nr:MFS transporter [Streptacidiphilus sp. PB12-B1b]QMU76260.1 MFS transporter [Streptacidiphilus sp. PB12-B1b]